MWNLWCLFWACPKFVFAPELQEFARQINNICIIVTCKEKSLKWRGVKKSFAMNWIAYPPNLYVDAQPQMQWYLRRPFERSLGSGEVRSVGSMRGISVWSEEIAVSSCTHSALSSQLVGPSANQEANPTMSAPWFWTWSRHNREKINFCYLSHPVMMLR